MEFSASITHAGTLRMIVMDPLLRSLEESGLGLSVNEFYAGGFIHNIWTIASSMESLEAQTLGTGRALHCWELPKTEFFEVWGSAWCLARSSCSQPTRVIDENERRGMVIHHPQLSSGTALQCEVGGSVLPVRNSEWCLGFWWKANLMASCLVEENIRKACRSFFHYGSIGIFQGDLCYSSAPVW